MVEVADAAAAPVLERHFAGASQIVARLASRAEFGPALAAGVKIFWFFVLPVRNQL